MSVLSRRIPWLRRLWRRLAPSTPTIWTRTARNTIKRSTASPPASVNRRRDISGGTVGARDGIRTHDPNLTKIVRYLCATRAYLGYVIGGALERRETFVRRWPEQDSNLRRRKPTDLQSVPVVHFGIWPCRACVRMWRAIADIRVSATGYYRRSARTLSRHRMYLLPLAPAGACWRPHTRHSTHSII